MAYVELHCHSNFSFLEGASHPDELVKRASEVGLHSLAITDKNGLYGIVRFSQAALKMGIKPIFGAELTLEKGEHTPDGRTLVVLVKDRVGYANLSRLLSQAQLKGEKGEAPVSEELLAEHTDGLIGLSGDLLSKSLLTGDHKQARKTAAFYAELFRSGNFYLEAWHHNLPHHDFLCDQLPRLGQELGLPLVVTNNAYYAEPDRRRLQDVLTCIKNHTTLDQAGALLYPNGERYLKSERMMRRLFLGRKDYSVFEKAIQTSERIASRCDFSLSQLKTVLPDFEVPAGETNYSFLRKLVYEGAAKRYDEITPEVKRQLEHELGLIHKLDFSGYFLIVWDIVRFANEREILVQGRGSAANSAVCYCLGITAVDPIRLKLLFERFISEARDEPPDIDIDIANNRREEVIQYVYERYGREHAAMVCEVISYRGRSAVRDVGKALGFSLGDLGRLAKQLSHFSSPDEINERLKEAQLDPNDARVRLLLDLCRQIKGFPRHLGIHVGGMIITERPLSEIVPIENASMPDRSVIQWDKDDIEAVRMVKVDLLGLGMLTLIDMALKLVKKHRGIEIDLARLSYADKRVYDLFCSADTVGVFQVESRAQMNTLPRHKPRCFYDLVVEVALIRPGPIQGGMVHPYLRRRNGEERITYPHPSLKPVLERTLGIPLFQEQGMQVAMIAAGFSPTEADQLRRAMSSKRSHERMEQMSTRLISGMMKNGISKESAERIYTQLAAFADFGFAESHAASFALLVYVSGYLKVYYPAEFYCAILNAQPMGFYSPSTLIYEAKRRGVRILSVDVTKSKYDCTVERNQVRLGLRLVRNIGEGAKERLSRELDGAPFKSVRDFVYRAELNQLALEQLALVGGFSSFGLTRRQALWQILSLLRHDPDELSLENVDDGKGQLPDMDLVNRLLADFKGMSLSTGPHPMTLLRRSLKEKGILSAEELTKVKSQKEARVAGMVIIRQRPGTAKGFIFLTLEDETGFANIVVKPHLVEKFRQGIMFSRGILVTGTVERRDGVVNLIGHKFESLGLDRKQVMLKSRDFR